MDIRQLIAALKVSQCGNFSEAADKLAFSQSAISKQINALEEELGVKIFDRGTQKQKVGITKEGEIILSKINQMVLAYNDLSEYVYDSSKEKTPTVSVGSIAIHGENGDVSLISDFIIQYPDMKCLNVCGSSVFLTDLLKNRYIDCLVLGVSTLTLWPVADFNKYIEENDASAIPIKRSKVCLGVGKNHRFWDRESVTLSELDGETILVKEDTPARSLIKNKFKDIESLCKDRGAIVTFKYIDDYSGRIRPMLAAKGAGIMITAANITQETVDVHWVPIEDYPFRVTDYFVYLKANKNPALLKMISVATAMSKEAEFSRSDFKNV